ncbi:MAG: 30S ribosomal protein S17e [Hadesarchaea archaeon]|nr:30S ribosomal protein S17e [Hadesarchaea archaeon]
MGKVKSLYIKRAARRLLERYPDKFSTDFKQNCQALDALLKLGSKPLRNRIAGFISNLLKQKKEV